MRTTIALFSVSIVTLLFANDPVQAQCASGWGLGIPDGRHSPCFEVNLDTSASSIGALPSHDERITQVTPSEENFVATPTTPIEGNIDREGVVYSGKLSEPSVASGGVIRGEGNVTNNLVIRPNQAPAASKRAILRDLFLRSSDPHHTVWLAAPLK